jgi:hypothetical protein
MLMKRATAISLLFLVGHAAGPGCGSSGGGKTSGTAGNGSAGSTGASGTQGSAGATAGATGGAGSAGGAGATGATGEAGADAGAGAAGTAGATGTAGADAGAGTAGAGGAAGGAGATGTGGATAMTFFVTSNKSMTGNLGGLTGADKRCQDLAMAAGQGGRTWHAYVSVAMGPAGTAVNAKDRIGTGPWYNSKGALVAANLTELHAPTKSGNYMLFVDEKGQPINGHWMGTPTPVEHDILTGSSSDGTLKANETCKDWTSAAHADKAWVGHSDGLGLNAATTPPNNSWNSAHENGGCDDTAPLGGAGRLYCFALN